MLDNSNLYATLPIPIFWSLPMLCITHVLDDDFITNKMTYENNICARSNPENSKCTISLKQKMQRIGCQIFPLSFINRGPAICDPPFTTHSHHHVYPATITATTDSHHATATTIHKVTELSQPEEMLRSLAFLGYGKIGMN